MPDLETSLAYCTYCPKLCRHTCPVSHAEARETLTPTTKMATMRRLRMYEGERTVESSDPLYGCTGCGACTEFCLHDIEVGASLFRGRDDAEREHRGHPSLAGFVARFSTHEQRAAARVRELVPAARRPLEAQVAFMPGCEMPELAPTMLEVCDRVGAEYVGIAETRHACGGYPLLAAGQHDAFRMHAERLAHELANYKRVVVHCPACAWTMKTQYQQVGVPLAPVVEHSTEFLAGFAERLPIARKRESAFYHDPCYLGRHQGLYDPPRKLAAKVISDLREFSRARGEAECSGGGGLLPVTMPSTAETIAENRLIEAREAGATTVVTSCSSCKRQLTRGGITAIDLVDLLAEAVKAE